MGISLLRYEAIQLLVEMCDSLDFVQSATQISLDEKSGNENTKIVIQMICNIVDKVTLREFVEKRNFRFEEKTNNEWVIY